MRRMKLPSAAAAFLMMSTLAALAHAKLVSSTPADGASIASGVSQIAMQFSHPMRLTLVKVHRAADDANVSLESPLEKSFKDSAKVDVAPLAAGAYDVSWTAVSKDGHVMKGHFGFTVTGAEETPAP